MNMLYMIYVMYASINVLLRCRLWTSLTIGIIHYYYCCIQVAIYTGRYVSWLHNICNDKMFYNVRDSSAILILAIFVHVAVVAIISHCIP